MNPLRAARIGVLTAGGRFSPPVPTLRDRLCLITGAASGIGRATARAAAADGARLVLTDINAAALSEVASELGGAVALQHALDVSDLAAVQALAAIVHEHHGSLDVLMNIAGIATWGTVDRLSHEQWARTIEVNLIGPIQLIESFVPAMISARRGGHIVNVSSAAGLVALPWHGPYSASKFGLRGLSEVLRFDLRRHRIGVSVVCPGAVDTGLVRTVDVAGVSQQARDESGLSSLFRRHAISPQAAAEKIIRGVTSDQYLIYTSQDIRALYLLERLAPPLYAAGMSVANDVFSMLMRRAAAG